MLSVPALRLLHVLRLRGTVTAAAEQLRLSRSAASHQLASLQRSLGVPLTERVGRGLRLTEAGLRLAEHAGRVLAELEEAESAVERLRGAPAGTVRIGAVQVLAVNLLPGLLSRVRDSHAALRIEARSITTEDAMTAVSSGMLDVAVVPSYDLTPLTLEGGLTEVRLFRDPVRLALPSGHRLAGRESVAVAELAGEQWIGGDEDSYFGRLVPTLCRRAGFAPDVVHHSGDYAVVASFVAAGHGVAVIPASADLSTWPGVTVTVLDADDAGRDIVALLRTGSRDRPAVRAVVRELRRQAVAESLQRSVCT
ncbi:LysR family transcriptional regulator [Stackebrandtia nassauensis]|uniref:Transcriptional regulator, LysR family n=1 Tax=Stackebrandtia nassauensis (strain DSM 44728 / CIP 108903 / NRRL B-16338 / NBRC 102104 / LLR-40K-21) TaxID=446470 RepID=D3PU84_STANL|nr:LysR family transcriptional regulator [Stackebrandtia nassauensis]ADD41030.1 transcriptional regulator, LysR family [Stackebrandtia nassauensis DSM 44728]